MASRLLVDNEDLKAQETLEEEDDEGFVSFGNAGIPVYEMELDESKRVNCRTLVFAEGSQAIAFAKNHLPLESNSPIGKIVKKTQLDKSDTELWGLHYKQPEPSLFFRVNQEILLCTCSSSMSSEDFYLFAKSVISSFKSDTSVLILTVSAISNFKSEDHVNVMETPLVRTLSTSTSIDPMKLTRLEQPNILGGIAAGILTVCDLKGIQAVACIVFSSSLNVETDIVDGFTKFLRSTKLTAGLEIKSVGRFPTVSKCAKTGNLYI